MDSFNTSVFYYSHVVALIIVKEVDWMNDTKITMDTDNTTAVLLSFKKRFDYSLCEIGYNITYYWVSGFMMIFFTDTIGVEAGAVSLLTLVVRIFDAINDPIIGSFADRTRSRWGRYRPWVFIGATAMCGLMLLMFSAQPDWDAQKKLVFMWVVYILVTIASTACNMPYGALHGVITTSSEERAKVGALRMMFANIGTNLSPVIVPAMIVTFSGVSGGPEAQRGFFMGVLVCISVTIPLFFYSMYNTKEVLQPAEAQRKIPVSKQFPGYFKNKYAVLVSLGFFALGFGLYGRMAMLSYYFTYNAGDISLMSYVGLLGLAGSIPGSGVLSVILYKKLKHKGKVMSVACLLAAASNAPMYFVGADSPIFWVCTFLSWLFFGSAIATLYSMTGDASDIGESITHFRTDGFIASFVSLFMKAGGAAGPAILLAIAGLLGYVPNVEQNPAVLNIFNLGISLVFSGMMVIDVILFAFYDMPEEKHIKIREANDAYRNKLEAESKTSIE
jgi:sugar (glycoside-pentoside-hexuronide) transporter